MLVTTDINTSSRSLYVLICIRDMVKYDWLKSYWVEFKMKLHVILAKYFAVIDSRGKFISCQKSIKCRFFTRYSIYLSIQTCRHTHICMHIFMHRQSKQATCCHMIMQSVPFSRSSCSKTLNVLILLVNCKYSERHFPCSMIFWQKKLC